MNSEQEVRKLELNVGFYFNKHFGFSSHQLLNISLVQRWIKNTHSVSQPECIDASFQLKAQRPLQSTVSHISYSAIQKPLLF